MNQRKFLLWGAPLALLLIFLLWSQWRSRDIEWNWTEEVALRNGQFLTIYRSEVRNVRNGEPFQVVRGIKRTSISFEPKAGNGRVNWESNLRPMIIERGHGRSEWTIIASSVWCDEFHQYGSLNPPYLQFDYDGNKWTWHPVGKEWYGIKSNMLVIEEQIDKNNGHAISSADIERLNKRFEMAYRRYAKVDPTQHSNCVVNS